MEPARLGIANGVLAFGYLVGPAVGTLVAQASTGDIVISNAGPLLLGAVSTTGSVNISTVNGFLAVTQNVSAGTTVARSAGESFASFLQPAHGVQKPPQVIAGVLLGGVECARLAQRRLGLAELLLGGIGLAQKFQSVCIFGLESNGLFEGTGLG